MTFVFESTKITHLKKGIPLNTINLKSHLYVIFATILVAGSFIASEKLSGVVNSFSLILLRFVICVVFLIPFIYVKKNALNKVKRAFLRAFIMSFFYTGYFVILFESLNSTTSLHTGTLFTLVPLLTAILYIFFFKEKITKLQLLVYFIGILGTCGIIFKGDIDLFLSFSLNSGDFLFLIGLLFMSSYSISMKYLYKKDDTLVLVFCTLIGGSIWMGLIIFFSDIPLNWHLIQGNNIFYMAYLVIPATLFTTYLYQKATIQIGPKSVMSYIYISPAAVALILFLLEKKVISIPVLIAILISTIATIILQISLSRNANMKLN